MCLYHYLYFAACQHGELTLISYCDKAKALGLAKSNSPSLRSVGNASKQRSTSLSSPAASNHNASHSHIQQHQLPNMATLSPSKPRKMPGCGLTPVQHERSSPQHAAFVPRSTLPEPGSQGPAPASPFSASLSAIQAIQALKGDDAHDNAFPISAEESRQARRIGIPSIASTSFRSGHNSDEETVQGSSEASIDIITERDTITYSDINSASPRKPIPAQWFPLSQSPTVTPLQPAKAHGDSQVSPSRSSSDRRPLRTTRSLVSLGKTHADTASFLTKEALDAVDVNITSPRLHRSPSKLQCSPTKVPWNSPTVSPKPGSLLHSSRSPIKPSSPRSAHLGAHVVAHHKRAPSSIVSTGATSFHTARGSPVRSSACSQSSFSSDGDLDESVYFHCFDYIADVDVEQVEHTNDRSKTSAASPTSTTLRSRVSRPELKIRIPPSDATFDAYRRSASTLPSASSNTAVSVGDDDAPRVGHAVGYTGATTQSRIPRVSLSKGSSARAPTLSSTLKQTKSSQTLRSPKTTKGQAEQKYAKTMKTAGTKPLHHVRTVDSTGSTPILSNRKSRDLDIPVNVTSVATASIQRTTCVRNVDLLTSYLQDTALEATGLPEALKDLPASYSHTLSRATSGSTIKASQIARDSARTDSAKAESPKVLDLSDNVHSSDADDEYDDSATFPPVRGRSAQYQPVSRRTTISEVSMQSSSTSDLRATASEFVPAVKDASISVADAQPLPSLPDLYALDGYGIPWFYHMYPVPWIFPPTFSKTRSKSPKKFKCKTQRSAIDPSGTRESDTAEMQVHMGTAPGIENMPIPSLGDARTGADSPCTLPAAALGAMPFATPMTSSNLSDGTFSSQLDDIARQAALQPKTKNLQPPKVDLTTICNVSTQDDYPRSHVDGYDTVPSRRRKQLHNGNGLYGGRGNVGVPLYATAPFPIPIPPMGKPGMQMGDNRNYVGHAIGGHGCGAVEVEKAAERGGGQACNTCEPDH